MEKNIIKNERTNEQYYEIKHPSGLDILVWPMEGFSTTEALFGTKYGSINTIFKTSDESDFAHVPEGIAHFLEHKLFENEDCDVFDLYAKTGASANAYTSFDKTCYLFSCSDNWQASLEILLSFVQEPYFTKETVDKEQGIIGQEIRMCDDNPSWRVFFNLLDGLYINHPVKIDIAGTVESIAKIDKDLLYRCYYTFYNLNNMCLSIAGNVDVDEVIAIADKLLKPSKDKQLEITFPDEPQTINKAEVVQNLPVGTPLFNIGFKSMPYEGKELVKAETVASILLSLIGGSTSSLYSEMTRDGLINSSFSSEVFTGDGYFACIFGGESKNPREVRDRIIKEIERVKIEGLDEDRFNIIKKSNYGQLIKTFNNVEAVASVMINSQLSGISGFETVEALANVTFQDITSGIDKYFDTKNVSISIVES